MPKDELRYGLLADLLTKSSAPQNTLLGGLAPPTKAPTNHLLHTGIAARGLADLLYPSARGLQRNSLAYGLGAGLLGPTETDLDRRYADQAAWFKNYNALAQPAHAVIQIFDVEHGACAAICSPDRQRIAMLDAGHNSTSGWKPSDFVRKGLRRGKIDYLFSLNFDQDHISDLVDVSRKLQVETLHRNPSANTQTLRRIKEKNGPLTDDAQQYLAMLDSFTAPIPVPFDAGMGGVTFSAFYNPYPRFEDTNNLSLVIFIKYGSFKILFPGDLERQGWLALLEIPLFREELIGTTVLVAAHHGRRNGYCEDIFRYFTPLAVIMSDKEVVHETQEMTNIYHAHCHADGIPVGRTNSRRRVLTTRKDGDIVLRVESSRFYTNTELNP